MKRTELKRKTPLRQKRPTPRRVATTKRAAGPNVKRRSFKPHRDWISTLPCHCCGTLSAPRRACHLRWHTDGGTGMRPHDSWVFPGCDDCHGTQHAKGEAAYWSGLNPWMICWTYAVRSPVAAIREYAATEMEYRLRA